MRHPRIALLATLLAAGPVACADAPVQPSARAAAGGGSEGRGDFQRYVAIGTSVSEGFRSDGVFAETQEMSWPAQLARLAHRELSLPLIAFPGCGAPLAAPLAAGLRVSGESATAPFPAARVCAPNLPGVVLPAGNVAISGATTAAALRATPESPDPGWAPLYARTLPPGYSQVTAMEAQNPKIVSVELGANEVLGARVGALIPGVTVVPVAAWAPDYHEVVERVAGTAKRAVLVGLIDDVTRFPSFRTGAELWAARATFAPFNVAVDANCSVAPGAENVLFVTVRVPLAAAQGAALAQAGQGPAVLSCANAPSAGPGGAPIADYVLSAAEFAAINAQIAAMNAIIRGEAESHGFAYFALEALYGQPAAKPPFNAVSFLTSAEPFGPLISLDGVHPSAAGSRVLAEAAARALNDRYGYGMPTTLAQ